MRCMEAGLWTGARSTSRHGVQEQHDWGHQPLPSKCAGTRCSMTSAQQTSLPCPCFQAKTNKLQHGRAGRHSLYGCAARLQGLTLNPKPQGQVPAGTCPGAGGAGAGTLRQTPSHAGPASSCTPQVVLLAPPRQDSVHRFHVHAACQSRQPGLAEAPRLGVQRRALHMT